MIKTCISKDWKFRLGREAYTDIDLPHDYAISQERSAEGNGDAGNGFFPNNVGRYVKYLNLEEKKHYILNLDGAYMCTQILLNENHLGMHPHGYSVSGGPDRLCYE